MVVSIQDFFFSMNTWCLTCNLFHQESDEDEDDSNSSDLDEPSTPAPTTASPEVFTEESVAETTQEPILPTIVTDNGRGDSIGGYPDDYKSIIYIEDKSYHKIPGPYKSYEYVNTGKKMGYDMNHGNDVEKSMQVYKIQVSTTGGHQGDAFPSQLLKSRLMHRNYGHSVVVTTVKNPDCQKERSWHCHLEWMSRRMILKMNEWI